MVKGIDRRYAGEGAGLEPEQQGESVQAGPETESGDFSDKKELKELSGFLDFLKPQVDALLRGGASDMNRVEFRILLDQILDTVGKIKDKVS